MRTRGAGHVAYTMEINNTEESVGGLNGRGVYECHVWERREMHTVLAGKPAGKICRERPSQRWESTTSIKIYS